MSYEHWALPLHPPVWPVTPPSGLPRPFNSVHVSINVPGVKPQGPMGGKEGECEGEVGGEPLIPKFVHHVTFANLLLCRSDFPEAIIQLSHGATNIQFF